MSASFILHTPGLGKAYSAAGDKYVILADGEQTGGAYCLAEAHVPPGGGPALHYHTREEESFYILEGEITFTVEGRELVAGPGSFVQVPRLMQHAFHNHTTAPARMLIQCSPSGFEDLLAEFATPLASVDAPPLPPSPAELERLLAAAPRYGIVLAPPQH